MASLNIPNSFSNGVVADATQVNANFNAVKSFAESAVVQVDGSVKAGTNAIADGAVTAAKIADGSVTASKLPANTFALTYQDFSVATDLNNFPFGQEVTVNLTGGKNFTHVVGVAAWGVNSNVSIGGLKLGAWFGQQTATEVKVFVTLGNNVASNFVTLRVWLTA